MYAHNCPPRPDKRQSLLAVFFYTFLYAILWLHYRTRNAFFVIHTCFTRFRNTLFKTKTGCNPPNHIAISGSISSHPDHLATIVAFIHAAGTNHVTLYDHLHAINPVQFATFLCKHDLHPCQITQIGPQKTRTYYHHSCLTHQHSVQPANFQITLVNPGTGRAAIARSARILAHRQTNRSPELTPDHVIQWLDRDHPRCMLPSEPDALVIFPESHSRSAPILNDFPVWQLRLTQIRFSPTPITHLSNNDFLHIVTTATSGPKRFGR